MAPDPARLARWATLVLATVAYVACEIASTPDGRLTPFGFGYGLALVLAAAVGSYFVPAPAPGQKQPPLQLRVLLGFVLIAPVAFEPVVREWTGNGVPLELRLVNGLRCLGLALAAAAAWPGFRKLAGVVALFLALFAAAMGDQPVMPYVLAALAVTGGLWLLLGYHADRAGPANAVGFIVERARLRVPARELLVFTSLAILAIGVAAAGPKRVIGKLGELVPTSGGTGDQDPFARYGMNDGPEEVRGENANSVGMIESDQFIESQRDSLLDVASDMYGPPHKPPQEQERMVAGGFERVKESHNRLPENKRPSRDFDTSRQGPKDPRKGASRAARALFEVDGRTPLHIATVAFDRYDFDSRRWLRAPGRIGQFVEADDRGGDWMRPTFYSDTGTWYAADDEHELKVADLKDHLVPTPALTTRFRIKKVNQPDYYTWDHDGVLGLAGRSKTPSGVIVHTACRTVDPTVLPAAAFPSAELRSANSELPSTFRSELERIARAWAGDVPRGWPQIEAILGRLRSEYVVDRSAAAPAEHPAPVLWFLTESHRGPDYLFATATALLLRSLGYPTRVCLGYYASPDAFDPSSQHTPVTTTDLHTWPEVLLRDGHWLVVEPTPGYAVLPPKRPWRDRLAAALTEVAAWAWRHALVLACATLGLTWLVIRRKAVADALFTAAWRLAPERTWQRSVLGTVRLLERRGRLAGNPRSPGQTLAGWAAELSPHDARAGAIVDLVRLAERAAYGPGDIVPAANTTSICQQSVQAWPRGRFRRLNTTKAE